MATAAILVALLAPAASSAGEYEVSYCRDATGGAMPLTDWHGEVNRPGLDPAWEDCLHGGPMVVDWSAGSLRRPLGSRTAWVLDAVPPMRIRGWRITGTMTALQLATYGEITGFPICDSKCTVNFTDQPSTPLNASSIEMHLICIPPPDGQCPAGTARISLSRARVTFNDPEPPTATSVEGSLLNASTPLAGGATVRVIGADEGSGVRQLVVRVDGQSRAASVPQCNPPYPRQQPCPRGIDSALTLNTTTLTDGAHTVQIVLRDASGGERTVWTGPILVQNSPDIGPWSDPALRGHQNGSMIGDGAQLTVAWPATARKRTTSKRIRRRCKRSAYRRKHPVTCNGRPASATNSRRYSTARSTLRGTLYAPSGQPIAGATLQLTRIPAAAGVPRSALPPLTTDSQGSFATSIPVADGSAQILVQYRPFARDTTTLNTTATLKVAAATTLHVRSHTRTGHTVRFRGTLKGEAGHRHGVVVSVQVRHNHRWRTIATPAASTTGHWLYKHHFGTGPAARGRYRFRAVVNPSGTYPYTRAATHRSSVRVR